MRIVMNLLTAGEVVFESPWGNEIHFRLDPVDILGDNHYYWTQVSPAIELKFYQWLLNEGRMNQKSAESIMNTLHDRYENRSLKNLMDILPVFEYSGGHKVPWVPASAEQKQITSYLLNALQQARFCFDLEHLEDLWAKQGTYLDKDSRHVQRLIDIMETKNRVMVFKSLDSHTAKYLPRLASSIGRIEPSRLLNEYHILAPSSPLESIVYYMLDKVE